TWPQVGPATNRATAERWDAYAGLGVAPENMIFLRKVVVDLRIALIVEEVDTRTKEKVVSREYATVGSGIGRQPKYVLGDWADPANWNLIVQKWRLPVSRVDKLVNPVPFRVFV